MTNILIKLCVGLIVIISLTCCALGQQSLLKEEYLKITPYLSTLEDVNKIYGESDDIIKGRDDYLSITYRIDENREVSIDYFRDCHQNDKPEKERTWIVEHVFFTFEENLKIKPGDIFLDKKDFVGCPYGDVGGQVIFFNKEKNIRFTYLSNNKAVSNLNITATEKNKERYKCKKDAVRFTLDPKGFRCNNPD